MVLYHILVNIAYYQYFDDLVYLFTRLIFDLDYDYLMLYCKIIRYTIGVRSDITNINVNVVPIIFKNMSL